MTHQSDENVLQLSDAELRVVLAMRSSERMGNAIYNYAKGFDPDAFSGVVNRERHGDFHPPHYTD